MTPLDYILLFSGIFSFLACVLSAYLIRMHLINFTQPNIQSKIVGILWMVIIYSIDSYISLLVPSYASKINMLRDCYEAYVLYLFLALMLALLGCEEEEDVYEAQDRNIIKNNNLNYIYKYLESDRNRDPETGLIFGCKTGKEFLRYCKFGTIQYCVIKPFITLFAFMLGELLSRVYIICFFFLQ